MAYTNLISLFKAICDAIRAKAGITGRINHQDIPAKIAAIQTPSDGSIPTKISSDLIVSGATVTAPAGYYASAASQSVTTATQATPSITVSSSGLITASATQSAGYVSSGTKSATPVQLNIHSGGTYSAGYSENQSGVTIDAGRYLTGALTMNLYDPNLKAENIAEGVSIFGVTGTLELGEEVDVVSTNASADISDDSTGLYLYTSDHEIVAKHANEYPHFMFVFQNESGFNSGVGGIIYAYITASNVSFATGKNDNDESFYWNMPEWMTISKDSAGVYLSSESTSSEQRQFIGNYTVVLVYYK